MSNLRELPEAAKRQNKTSGTPRELLQDAHEILLLRKDALRDAEKLPNGKGVTAFVRMLKRTVDAQQDLFNAYKGWVEKLERTDPAALDVVHGKGVGA